MEKRIFTFFISVMFLFILLPVTQAEEAEMPLDQSLLSISSSSYDLYTNQWDDRAFEDSNGNIVDNGFGFKPYLSDLKRIYAQFNIQDFSYTTLETSISLENSWRKGDLGRTTIEIYADNKEKLYNQSFENITPVQNIALSIPNGTKYLSFYVISEPGPQGNHGLILGNPRLTNKLPQKTMRDSISLADIGTSSVSSNYDYSFGTWESGGSMVLSNNEVVSRAVGLVPYKRDDVRTRASYFVGDSNYSTLETTISIEKGWGMGDRGKSEAVIYADNVKVYSKTFTNLTEQKSVKIQIPKGTKYIHLYGLFEKGSQGNHGIIYDNPILTNELEPLLKDDTISLYSDISMESKSGDYDVYSGEWNSRVFQMSDGSLEPWGYGFAPYNSDHYYTYANFYIGDYRYPTLETQLSVDSKWNSGDRGQSIVTIIADSKAIYKSTLTNASKTQNVIAAIPVGTKYLQFLVNHTRSNAGHAVIFGNPRLTNRPNAPILNKITVNSTKITGKAQARTTVMVKMGSKELGKTITDGKGNFSFPIVKQKAGTVLTFSVIDSLGRESAPSTAKVIYETSKTLSANQVKISNNRGKTDTVSVNGLNPGDSIKLYSSNGKIIGKAVVSRSAAVIEVKQLGTASGKIFITLQQPGKLESGKLPVSYNGEKK